MRLVSPRHLWSLVGGMLIAALALLPACTPTEVTPSDEGGSDSVSLVILGFTAGGSMQMRADALAEAVRLEHPDWQVASLAPGGEARLIEARINGEADFYLPPVFRRLEVEVHAPLHPDIDYEQATDYRLVMPSSFVYVHLFALDRTGLTSFSDLVARRYPFTLGVGAGNVRLLWDKMLRYYGSSIQDTEAWGAHYETMLMSSAEGVEALQSGRVDMGFTYGALPNPAYMGAEFDLGLLDIADPGLVQALEAYGCVPGTIPAGTYPFVDADVTTVGTQESFVTRPDMPDDIVYAVCEAMFAHQDVLLTAHPASGRQLTPEAIAAAVVFAEKNGLSFHPGALKYFRDQGWLD